jgi:hypothetical protein
MGTTESAKSSNAAKTTPEPAKQSSQVTLDWLNVYSQVYRETLTPELIIAYQAALNGIDPQILHKAFLRQMKLSTFRPTPAEVLKAVAVEYENIPKPKQLEAPPMTAEERVEIERSFAELRKKLSIPERTSVDGKRRREELRTQARQVMKKYPSPGRK